MFCDIEEMKDEFVGAGKNCMAQLSPYNVDKKGLNECSYLFLLANIDYDSNSFMEINSDNGFIYVNMIINCEKPLSYIRKALKRYASYKLNSNDVSLIPEYEGKDKIFAGEVISDNAIFSPTYDTKMVLAYSIYTNKSLKLKHRVVRYLLEHYLDYLDGRGEQYNISSFYKPLSGAVKIIDTKELEKDGVVRELKKKLTAGTNPLIFNDWTPNLKEYDIKAILNKIKKHFTQKKKCAICGEEFTPSHNKPNQFVCGKHKCVKLKSQKKKSLKQHISKHKPQSKQEIIEYMKGREVSYSKRHPNMGMVKYWDMLVEGLLEEIRMENNEKKV